MSTDPNVRPLAECTVNDLVNCHAFVYGRVRIWTHDLTDTAQVTPRWSKYAWWKAMWYSHAGGPQHTGNWGVYAGADGYTGRGDAELTHFMQMPEPPIQADQGSRG